MAIPHYSTFHTTPQNSTQFHIIPHFSTLFHTFPQCFSAKSEAAIFNGRALKVQSARSKTRLAGGGETSIGNCNLFRKKICRSSNAISKCIILPDVVRVLCTAACTYLVKISIRITTNLLLLVPNHISCSPRIQRSACATYTIQMYI